MSTTKIDTGACERVRLDGNRGEVAEIVNKALCGAENVLGMLRWLGAGERFAADTLDDRHQLIYLMEGEGSIALEGKDYEVARGAGVYLEPGETAAISQRGAAPVKLFHLVVPRADG